METEEKKFAYPTAGELFPDWTAIDLLRCGQLVYWDGQQEHIDSQIDVCGRRYRAVELAPALERAINLPHSASYLATAELLARMAQQFQNRACLDYGSSWLAALGVTTSWVSDTVAGGAPVVNFWSPSRSEGAALDIVQALCRRPLRLVRTSVQSLSALPNGLYPTIITVDSTPNQLELLAGAGRGAYVIRGKSVSQILHSVVAFTHQPLRGALNISLLPSAARATRLASDEIEELEMNYQPFLLGYRLRNHRAIRNSGFDVNEFAPEVRSLAHALGATLEGEPALQHQLTEALALLDEHTKAQTSAMPAAIIIECLQVACHEERAEVFISDLADLANALLMGRGEKTRLSPKAVGGIVHELGVLTKRRAAGYAVTLNVATREFVRQLAESYGVLSNIAQKNCS